MRRVLHLVDRVAGGVPVAVRTYIRHSPGGYRHIVASPFVDGAPSEVWGDLAVEHVAWDTSTPVRAVRDLRRLRGRHPIDVVHAHSSFPGVYARMLRWAPNVRMVYTPHCFAFSRTDVGAAKRAVFRQIETVLAGRAIVAACGAGERRLALALGVPEDRALVIPNVTSFDSREWAGEHPEPSPQRIQSRLRVGMLGRWAAQKDPDYFVRCVHELGQTLASTRIDASWIGDGESTAPRDIRVTGWLPSGDVYVELRRLDVYLHTAAWEGFPIALLDAHAAGLPILARAIPALADVPRMLTIDEGMPGLIDAIENERFTQWRTSNRRGWADYLGPRSASDQRRALSAAWG